MDRKFISFDPWWGGFSNVRMSYELATAISIITNRTLILPPKVYCFFLSNHQDKNSFINVWDFFDKNKFTSNISSDEYHNILEYKRLETDKQYFNDVDKIAKTILFEGDDSGWHPNLPIKNNQVLVCDITDRCDFEEFSKNREIINLNLDDKFIHFPRNLFGHFYYHVYGKSNDQRNLIKQKIKDSICYKQEYHDIAYQIKNTLGSYNSIHVRRNDFTFVRKDYVDNQTKNLKSVLLEKIPRDLPLYIATDEKDKSFFNFLKPDYNIFFLNDFLKDLRVQESLIVDQITCVNSEIFLGSRLSTFSDYINIMRGYEQRSDYHREGTNYSLPILTYKKYPWEVEPYAWENIHKFRWTYGI